MASIKGGDKNSPLRRKLRTTSKPPFRTALVVMAISSVSMPASSQQQVDPYAEAYKARIVADYLKDRARLMEEIEFFYFGLGCKVFLQEGQFLQYTSEQIRSVAYGNTHGISEPEKIGPMARDAALAGLQKAERPNECSYWTENPNAVYRVRRKAEIYRR